MSYFKGNQYVKGKWLKAKRAIIGWASIVTKGMVTLFKGYVEIGVIVLALYVLIVAVAAIYMPRGPETVQAEVKPVEEIPAVMQRIFKCESSANHTAKNGQITYHVNTDGTIDIGIGEINTVHFAEATKLGYDLTKESDNKAFAMYLYHTKGTEPWYSSRKCWNK